MEIKYCVKVNMILVGGVTSKKIKHIQDIRNLYVLNRKKKMSRMEIKYCVKVNMILVLGVIEKERRHVISISLTFPMLRRLSSKAQGRNFFWKPSKPCNVGIRWIAFTEYSQMSTHMPFFQSI